MLERLRRWLEWRSPEARDARNEQRKLRAALANAVAIGALITAFIGPAVNPALSVLSPWQRFGLALVGLFAHLLAARLVRDVEDK